MAKSYRPVLRDQPMLLPVDMRDWLPGDHLVWFVLDTVDVLDIGEFERGRRSGVGAAGYDPRMLLGLLIYAYCRGVRSSRQVERLCCTDIAFRVLCAQDVPDHATIARFRAQHQDAFADLFGQVLMIAGRAGLARFGTVAIDGTKIAANASIDANRGQAWFAEQAATMVAEAGHVDAIEDARADEDENLNGDRIPARLVDRSHRMERIRDAAQQLTERRRRLDEADHARDAAARERLARSQAGLPVPGCIPKGPHHLAEARAHLARELRDHQAKLDRRAAIIASGKKPMGAAPVPTEQHSRVIRARRVVAAAEQAAARAEAVGDPPGGTFKHRKPKNLPRLVVNTTDPDSRIMPTRRGFVQGYNAQLAVTGDQLVVAVALGQSTNDQACFVPMMHAAQQAADQLHARTDNDNHRIGTVLADAGYAAEANLTAPGPARLIALGKGRDQYKTATQRPAHGPPPAHATARQAMQHRLRTENGRALYKRRGATVEPAIGNLKAVLGRFSRRGQSAALGELQLAASAFNLMKIYRAANT